MRKQKVAFLLIDGLGDTSIPQLGNQTPLQAAFHPNMNNIAKWGMTGLMDPVEPGLSCGSDTAHMSIFGYEPRLHYRGRGAFESMGAGLEMMPGDIAFKSNFATLDPTTNVVLFRRADRNFEDIGPIFCEYLTGTVIPGFENFQVDVKYSTEHRCGVRVRKRGPPPDGRDFRPVGSITGTDPLVDNKKLIFCEPSFEATASELEDAKRTSQLVNALSKAFFERLSQHPINKERAKQGKNVANIVLLRGCGVCIEVEPFSVKHGMRPFMIAPTAIIAGLGMSVGFDVFKPQGATGDYHTDLNAKAVAFIEKMTGAQSPYEFGFLHVKAVDDASHDGNFKLKTEFIERIDAMFGRVLQALADDEKAENAEYTIVVTGDHSTPCLFGDHSHEPVPFAICKLSKMIHIYGPNATIPILQGDSQSEFTHFDEIESARGSLGRFPGSVVMDLIKHIRDSNMSS